MTFTKCLIAGLPASGKSTYIGALWYNLRQANSESEMKMRSDDDLPNDINTLTHLSNLWKVGTRIDRTNSNATDSVQINIEDKESKTKFILEVPDFLGETFRDIIDFKANDQLGRWCEDSDTLLYFIEELNPGEFEDDDIHDEEENSAETEVLPTLTSTDMALDAQNIMILKFLFEQKEFEKVVFVLSRWDRYTDNGKISCNPEEYLKRTSPALFNFITHHVKSYNIVGMSAQGCSYPDKHASEENLKVFKSQIIALTRTGKRAFVEVGDEILYDLSLPLYMLLH